jgi:hypothetical protein
MLNISQVDPAAVVNVAQNGSPLLLSALGRLYGIGPGERQALGEDGTGVPTWTWAMLAFATGCVVGARFYKSYPGYVPEIISG